MKFNVNEVEALIANRRTIKPEEFGDVEVTEKMINRVLASANWAPTHGYTEPWRFVVFCNDGLKKLSNFHTELYKSVTPFEKFKQVKYDKIASRLSKTSVAIALIMKRGENEKIPEIEELLATGCAVQNMQLMATALGLGAYWGSGGMTYHPEMIKFLGYGPKDKMLGFMYLGFPKNEWPTGKRLTPIEKKVNWITD